MRGIDIDRFDTERWIPIRDWLHECYGPPDLKTWYVDVQPMMEDLIMNDEIYVMFMLRWA